MANDETLAKLIAEVQALTAEIRTAVETIKLSPDQIQILNGLSDISKDIGLITSGEFRIGNRMDPGKGFTGVRINEDGVRTYNNDAQTTGLESDGDLILGSDVSVPATTGYNFFATAHTYNGESMGAGDILLGDNSATKSNVLWDASAGEILFRLGTSTYNRISTSQALPNLGLVDYATDYIDGQVSTTSTTWTDISSAGPTLSVDAGPNGVVLALLTVRMSHTDGQVSGVGIGLDGADPSNSASMVWKGSDNNVKTTVALFDGLSEASHDFETMYVDDATGAGESRFSRRRLTLLSF